MQDRKSVDVVPGWAPILAWAVVLAGLLLLLFRTVKYGGYFPDDAYITFRFAQHLAEGHGIVWNIGGPPTEGSTSLLQTVMMAAAFASGLTVWQGATLISWVSVALLAVVFWRSVVLLAGRFGLGGALPLALFLGGAHVSVHANSGMDTIVAMTLLPASFLASLALVRAPGLGRALVVAGIGLLALWCRPDAAPFLAGQGLVLVVVALAGRQPGFLRHLVIAYGLLVAAGLAYLGWKLSYYGYLLPNSFYVKATEPGTFPGLEPVMVFLKDMGLRLAFVAPLLLFVDWRGVVLRPEPGRGARLALLVVPVAAFLFYNTTTLHLVGFHYRFEYPVAGFFWIAAAWLLVSGQAFDRLARVLGGAGPVAAGVVALVLVAGMAFVDRVHHRQWFAWVQWTHYEPMAAALIRAGGGPEVTLVYDAAGYVPFASRASFLDPVGLVDNRLSGREPITPMEREAYIWGSEPDVYLGPIPPASAGAAGPGDEPMFDTAYGREVLLSKETYGDYGAQMETMTDEELREALHFRMRELRDNWIAVGEFPYFYGFPQEYTHFIFVRRGSPYAEALVAEMSRLVTRDIAAIDFDALLDGQVRPSLEDLRALSALP